MSRSEAPGRMADRPGETDVADVVAIRRAGDALRWHEQNYIASKMEAEFARLNARLSDYEQARDVLNEWRHGSDWMGEGSGQMPDRVAILRIEDILFPARAALSGSAGNEAGE